MKKNKKIIIGAIILAVVILTGLIIVNKNTDRSSSEAAKFHQSYTGVPENNKFVYATEKEVIDIFEKGDGLVFLGFPNCPWCQKLAPIVNEAAEKTNLDKIYYLNIQEARANNDETYKKLLTYLSDDLQKDEDGNPRIYVPDVTAVSNGEIVARYKQEVAEGNPTPDEYWTAERKQNALKQIEEMINNMNQSEFSKIETQVKNGDAILLDVRSPQEFATGHFANATNLDVEEIRTGKTPDVAKDSKIYLYCRSGNRSAQATSLLKEDGFNNITDLGGLPAVQDMGGKLVTN